MLSTKSHWSSALTQIPGRRWRGSPESEDLPVALHTTNPSRKEDSWPSASSHCSFSRSSCQRPPLAANVHVRVEGKTQTIWGTTAPTLTATTAKDALEQASIAGEFYYHVTVTSFGPYVDQIGRYGGDADSGWVFKVNNVSPPVGADQVTLADGDNVLWYYATFGPNGGPPTLSLGRGRRAAATGSTAYDDAGKPAGVERPRRPRRVEAVDPTTTGAKVCPGPHPGVLVRATATGAVRSNSLK